MQMILASGALGGAYYPDLPQSSNVTRGTIVYPAMIINDFNSPEDVATWSAGENTMSVNFVTGILNGPGSVYEGAGALEQVPEAVKVYEWRTIYREFAEPLDLSDYLYLTFAANSYGWQPVDFVMKVRLYMANEVQESVAHIRPDTWSTIFVDISGWAGRNAVTKMEFSFVQNFDLEGVAPGAPGYDAWTGRFQLDLIAATNALDLKFSKDGDPEGFAAAQGTIDVSGGSLQWQIAGAGDSLSSPLIALSLAERNAISIRLANDTPASQLKVQWTTVEQPEWSEQNAKTFEIRPRSDFSVYDLNLSDKAGWSGTLQQIRIEPLLSAGESGSIRIDEITFKILPPLGPEYIGTLNSPLIQGDGTVTVAGHIDETTASDLADGQLILYELPTYADPTDAGAERVMLDTAAVQPDFQFNVPLTDGNRSRLFSKFAVALETNGEVFWVDAPQYIVNPDALAENRYPFPAAKSKKGLQVQYTDDAEELGISHAALNVAYDQMLYLTGSNPGNTIPYEFQGRTYYFKKNYIDYLDREIKSLSDNGNVVSLILIMYRNLDPSTPNSILIHPDSEPNGTVYAFNTKTADGVAYFSAITNFLAERYTRADAAYGRAVNFIVGNEIGQNKIWNNMGPKLIHEYVEDYARTLRLTDTIVRSHYDKARVYISLDHFWSEDLPPDSLWKYDNKQIVDLLTSHIRAHGDIPWNVAFHPYPENLFNPRFWNDTTATFDFDTDRITFKNLSVLVDYMKQPDYLFNGEMRRIILSEQGFHSLDNSLESQKIQAAAYAYAYYIVKFLDGIDSFILHRHVDHALEGGLNLGLWTNLPGQIATPDKQKVIYDVFKYIDTDRSLEVTEFAKEIIGIEAWEEVIPNFDPSQLGDREIPKTVPASLPKQPLKPVVLSDFESGTDGWTFADNSNGVTHYTESAYEGTGALQVHFSTLSKMWRGAELKLPSPMDFTRHPVLNLALKVPGNTADRPYYAKVKVYSGQQIAEGIIPLHQPSEWTYAALDLRGWSGLSSIDRIKVWMNSPSTDNWSGSFLIDSVSFSERTVPQGGVVNLDIVPTLLSDQLEAGSQIEVTVTNYDAADLTGDMEVSSDDLQLQPTNLHLTKIQPGQAKTFLLTVDAFDPAAGEDSIEITFKYKNTVIVKTMKLH
jgi:hypothetical protein